MARSLAQPSAQASAAQLSAQASAVRPLAARAEAPAAVRLKGDRSQKAELQSRARALEVGRRRRGEPAGPPESAVLLHVLPVPGRHHPKSAGPAAILHGQASAPLRAERLSAARPVSPAAGQLARSGAALPLSPDPAAGPESQPMQTAGQQKEPAAVAACFGRPQCDSSLVPGAAKLQRMSHRLQPDSLVVAQLSQSFHRLGRMQ